MAGGQRFAARGELTVAFALTVSLFALWGMGHWLYEALVPRFARSFHLSGDELAVTQSVYSVVYFVGAIPAALFARRFGGKIAILAGLGAIGIGSFLLYPALQILSYPYFLTAVTVMAGGWVALEVAANPLAACLGSPERFIWRLNFAQSFYPLGALAGMIAGTWLLASNEALPDQSHTMAIGHPYIVLGIGVLLLAYLFEEVRFPHLPDDRIRGGCAAAIGLLFRRRLFLFALAAQALSVMALVSVWSPEVRAFIDALPGRPSGLSGSSLVWMLMALAAGRFAGTAAMRAIAPASVLAAFSIGGIASALLVSASNGQTAAVAALTASFFVSITWPTILGLAIRDAGSSMKPGTALICMAGAAGGVLHQFIRVALPFPSPHLAILPAAFCFAAILVFALCCRAATSAAVSSSGDDV
jgi:FHS family L-fucose permease-like MFS transporter